MVCMCIKHWMVYLCHLSIIWLLVIGHVVWIRWLDGLRLTLAHPSWRGRAHHPSGTSISAGVQFVIRPSSSQLLIHLTLTIIKAFTVCGQAFLYAVESSPSWPESRIRLRSSCCAATLLLLSAPQAIRWCRGVPCRLAATLSANLPSSSCFSLRTRGRTLIHHSKQCVFFSAIWGK